MKKYFASTNRCCIRHASFLFILQFSIVLSVLTSTVIWTQVPPLVIAAEDAAGPWSFADGTGYANDIVISAFKAVGVEVELRVMPYARCKRMTINGEVAASFSMSPSPEFDGIIELSEKPLFTCFADYFCNVDRPPTVSRQEDLPRKTIVGTVVGYEYPAAFETLKQKGIIVVEESPSELLNLKKLSMGRVDVALVNHNQVKSPKWLMMRAGVTDKVRIAFRSGVLKSYIGFSKKHPKGMWAFEQFNKGYRIIGTTGTLRRIEKKWLEKLNRDKDLMTPMR